MDHKVPWMGGRLKANKILKAYNLIWKLHDRKIDKKSRYKKEDGRICKYFIWVSSQRIDWHDKYFIGIKLNRLQVKGQNAVKNSKRIWKACLQFRPGTRHIKKSKHKLKLIRSHKLSWIILVNSLSKDNLDSPW